MPKRKGSSHTRTPWTPALVVAVMVWSLAAPAKEGEGNVAGPAAVPGTVEIVRTRGAQVAMEQVMISASAAREVARSRATDAMVTGK